MSPEVEFLGYNQITLIQYALGLIIKEQSIINFFVGFAKVIQHVGFKSCFSDQY